MELIDLIKKADELRGDGDAKLTVCRTCGHGGLLSS